MNNADFQRDRSSQQLSGRKFIIVVVVVFSALSFTLGYFVGKSGADKDPASMSRPAEIMPAPQKQEPETLPQPQGALMTENTILTEETNKDMQSQQKDPFVIAKAEQPGPSKEKMLVQSVAREIQKENNHKSDVKENTVSQESTQTDGPLYTVQLNAFRSSSDAEAFSKKQARNGLKTYIISSVNAKQETIYKVRTGEFKDRKKAESLSMKLNKTGKLKTFVAFKNQ